MWLYLDVSIDGSTNRALPEMLSSRGLWRSLVEFGDVAEHGIGQCWIGGVHSGGLALMH